MRTIILVLLVNYCSAFNHPFSMPEPDLSLLELEPTPKPKAPSLGSKTHLNITDELSQLKTQVKELIKKVVNTTSNTETTLNNLTSGITQELLAKKAEITAKVHKTIASQEAKNHLINEILELFDRNLNSLKINIENNHDAQRKEIFAKWQNLMSDLNAYEERTNELEHYFGRLYYILPQKARM